MRELLTLGWLAALAFNVVGLVLGLPGASYAAAGMMVLTFLLVPRPDGERQRAPQPVTHHQLGDEY